MPLQFESCERRFRLSTALQCSGGNLHHSISGRAVAVVASALCADSFSHRLDSTEMAAFVTITDIFSQNALWQLWT